MFHTLFDYEDQNADFNRQNQNEKSKNIYERFNFDKSTSNYFGKGNFIIDEYNIRKNIIEKQKAQDDKFEKTKNKIKVVIYKNGFTLNDGPFRDRSLEENHKFMESVERGKIPQELIKKGIKDLGIFLENRKNEYYPYSTYNKMNIFDNPNIFQSQNMDFNQFPDIQPVTQNNGQTFIQHENINNKPIFYSKTYREKPTNKCKEKMDIVHKQYNKDKIINLSDIIGDKDENENGGKKFNAFSGAGKTFGNIVNMEEFHVDKNLKNFVDYLSPICIINIRLFNGEIIKEQFNYNQTLRDIYIYVRRISGSNKFILLDGFPPKPLYNLGMTIGELKLQNSVLTQKIN